jgi:hypothetical protein
MKTELEECEEHTKKSESALKAKKSQAIHLDRLNKRLAVDYAKKAQHLREEALEAEATIEVGINDQDVFAATEADEVCRLANALQQIHRVNNDKERHASYGLYERWRRRVDRHLCAGGAIERSNKLEFLDASRGYVPVEELVQAEHEEAHARIKRGHTAEEFDAARCRVASLRAEVNASEVERQQLWREVASQRQVQVKWWQAHMEHVPEYCQQIDVLRGHEAAAADMHENVEYDRLECHRISKMEDMAALDLREAVDDFKRREAAAQRASQLEARAARTTQELHQRTAWHPTEIDKLKEVEHVDKKLQQIQQFTNLCATEAEEARKTEARCALEKQGLTYSLKRAQEELSDVCQHIELLRAKHKTSSRILLEREDARQDLLRVHADLTLDHERQKLALTSHGLAIEDLGERCRPNSSSLSPRSRYATSRSDQRLSVARSVSPRPSPRPQKTPSLISAPLSSIDVKGSSPAPSHLPGRRRAL